MRHLHTLHISHAGLTLSVADMQMLARLPLQILQLNTNAIDLTPGLAAHFSQMTSLRELSLSDNPLGNARCWVNCTIRRALPDDCLLTQWPTGLTELMERQDCRLRDLQLSNNHITEFPALERILQSHFVNELRTGRRLIIWTFFDNGIPEETAERLRGAGVRILETRELLPQPPAANVPAVPLKSRRCSGWLTRPTRNANCGTTCSRMAPTRTYVRSSSAPDARHRHGPARKGWPGKSGVAGNGEPG